MRKNKLLLLLALLMTVATGAWADTTVTWTASDMSGLYIDFIDGIAQNNTIKGITATGSTGGDGRWDGDDISAMNASNTITFTSSVGNIKSIAIKAESISLYPQGGWTLSDENKKLSWSGEASSTVSLTLSVWDEIDNISEIVFTIESAAAPTYSVTLAEGTEDEGNWNVPAEAAEGATVTATYSGEKKVKSVKAVKKEVGPEVSTFSELQAVLSAGKDVKLMNDIVCTAGIEINSDGALTIDGNGKTLSTTSEIRAFKVESSATVAFKNLTLTGFVNEGGPAINNSGTIVLDGCTISNCHVNIDYSSDGGGAIQNNSSGKLYAINTTFSGNYSGEIGGAINNYRGSLYMSGCTFTDNYTTSSNAFYGGAIGINRGSEVRLINCSFSGNKYGTNTGASDIGVYSKPGNYTIAGCKGVTIASDDGDITPIASGTATLDYSDLSNISFTYTPITVTWNYNDITGSGNSFTKDGVTITANYVDFTHKDFNDDGTFTTTLGNFTKIEVSGGNCGASRHRLVGRL